MEEVEEEGHARRSWHQPVTPPLLLPPSVSLLNQITPPPPPLLPPHQPSAHKPVSQSILSITLARPLPFSLLFTHSENLGLIPPAICQPPTLFVTTHRW